MECMDGGRNESENHHLELLDYSCLMMLRFQQFFNWTFLLDQRTY